MKKLLKQLINRKGIVGYLASLLYFSYGGIVSGGGIRSGINQAYNRQGFDLINGTDTSETLTSDKKYLEIYSDLTRPLLTEYNFLTVLTHEVALG